MAKGRISLTLLDTLCLCILLTSAVQARSDLPCKIDITEDNWNQSIRFLEENIDKDMIKIIIDFENTNLRVTDDPDDEEIENFELHHYRLVSSTGISILQLPMDIDFMSFGILTSRSVSIIIPIQIQQNCSFTLDSMRWTLVNFTKKLTTNFLDDNFLCYFSGASDADWKLLLPYFTWNTFDTVCMSTLETFTVHPHYMCYFIYALGTTLSLLSPLLLLLVPGKDSDDVESNTVSYSESSSSTADASNRKDSRSHDRNPSKYYTTYELPFSIERLLKYVLFSENQRHPESCDTAFHVWVSSLNSPHGRAVIIAFVLLQFISIMLHIIKDHLFQEESDFLYAIDIGPSISGRVVNVFYMLCFFAFICPVMFISDDTNGMFMFIFKAEANQLGILNFFKEPIPFMALSMFSLDAIKFVVLASFDMFRQQCQKQNQVMKKFLCFWLCFVLCLSNFIAFVLQSIPAMWCLIVSVKTIVDMCYRHFRSHRKALVVSIVYITSTSYLLYNSIIDAVFNPIVFVIQTTGYAIFVSVPFYPSFALPKLAVMFSYFIYVVTFYTAFQSTYQHILHCILEHKKITKVETSLFDAVCFQCYPVKSGAVMFLFKCTILALLYWVCIVSFSLGEFSSHTDHSQCHDTHYFENAIGTIFIVLAPGGVQTALQMNKEIKRKKMKVNIERFLDRSTYSKDDARDDIHEIIVCSECCCFCCNVPPIWCCPVSIKYQQYETALNLPEKAGIIEIVQSTESSALIHPSPM